MGSTYMLHSNFNSILISFLSQRKGFTVSLHNSLLLVTDVVFNINVNFKVSRYRKV